MMIAAEIFPGAGVGYNVTTVHNDDAED